MSLTNPKNVITEERLAEFYQQILPYLGGMPDVLANKFNKSDLYSTDEQIIGRWIDGKPLYQRAYQLNQAISSGWNNTGVSASGMSNLISGFIIDNQTPTQYFSLSGIGTEDGNVVISPNYSSSRTITYFVLQYTKTSDSPIAIGSDTDYSTTEKIVGTWIDGKPIYQKTIEFNATGQSITTTYLNLEMATLSNIENVINPISGYAEWGDTIQPIPLSVDITGSIWADYNFNYSENKLYFRAKRSSGTTALGKIYATLQYTKTTD